MTGRVLKSVGNLYTVLTNQGQSYRCRVRGKLRLKESKTTNPIAVGDIVDFDVEAGDVNSITNVHPRKNYIIRRATNLSRQSHVIAANIDQTLLVVTVKYPETHFEFIDRYLATAEAYEIKPIIAFNKIDLYKDELKDKFNLYLSIYKPIYPCIELSAVSGVNMDILKDTLKDQITLVSGNSGVGKSTLINSLEPSLNLKTSHISHYHQKGMHTTTFSEMLPLSFGGYIIDTPGLKGFGLVDMDKRELFHFFPEIFRVAANCQFYNCTHQQEPGCAVKRAVEENAISGSRYASYLSMLEDTEGKYRS